MKKRLVWIVLWMFILGIPTVTFAADTLTTKSGAIWRIGDITKREVILTWIDDGGDGVAESIDFSKSNLNMEGWILYSCVTDPGATSPTDDYDITLVDKWGVDKMGGAMLNRDETNSEEAFPTAGYPVVNGPTWTFTVSGNSVSNATGVCSCIFFSN